MQLTRPQLLRRAQILQQPHLAGENLGQDPPRDHEQLGHLGAYEIQITALMDLLGNPQRSYPVIQIAGPTARPRRRG